MAAEAPAVGAVLGHYRIVEKIGEGGMGVVFRARDERLERDVAVKVLPPGTFPDESARKRFRREALVLAKLHHANIVMAFDFGQQNGIDYLVTEFVSGTTLDTKLLGGALPQKQVIDIGIQLAKGLAAAHREQITHRDLKPGNLRVAEAGELKILDFGLARWHRPADATALTASLLDNSKIAGTLPYMSPEQIRGEQEDERADIWSAGCVLYEMATGQRPFPMREGLKLIDAIRFQDPVPPRSLNPEITDKLEAVILKALDKDPERRYQSARELGVDLLRLLPDSQAHTQFRTDTFIGPVRRNFWKQWSTWAGLAALAIVFVYAGYRHSSWSQKPRMTGELLTILPFESSGQDEKTNALLAGLTDTITASLSQTWGKSLQLVPAREVREQGVKTTEQAWKEFGSQLVLEGNAHTVGDQIRINCSLVDSRNHRQISARTITAQTGDIFGLEDHVAGEITALLADNLGLNSQPAVNNRQEDKPEAYASYLRARGYLHEYQKPENIDLAVAELKNAVTLDPGYAKAYAMLGEAYLLGYQQVNRGTDWVHRAQQNCEKSLSLRETGEGCICLGDTYNQTGKYDLAVAEFQRAVQIDPNAEDGLRGLADAYEKLGNLSEAEAAYRKAIALRPNYWGVYSWLGNFYFNHSRYEDAAAQFQKVIDLAPNNYRGYSNLGAMYVSEGKYKESLSILNKSIEIRPNLEAFNNLGNAYFGLRRFSEAADAFQQGLNLDDSDWLLWGNLGDSLFWSGTRRAKAAAAYENAISRIDKRLDVNPKDAVTLAFAADYNAMAGHHAKALDQIERAMALDPTSGEVRLRAAIVYNQLNKQELCLASLERAVALGYSPKVIHDTPDFDHLRSNARFKKIVGQ